MEDDLVKTKINNEFKSTNVHLSGTSCVTKFNVC